MFDVIWKRAAGLAVVLGVVSGCGSEPGDSVRHESTVVQPLTQKGYRELARHWAPRLYQDTADAFYKGDYITKLNYDGDYNSRNNWENLDAYGSVPAYVYYAVSESATHYFLHYGIFHPRDWHEFLTLEMHENDFEGLTLVVRKNGGFGTLEAMETLAHNNFYQYAHAAGIVSGTDNVDGQVSLYGGSHPRVFIEAKGHGVYGCDSRCDAAPGGDGIVYAETDVAESPDGGSGNWTRVFGYRLIAMDADGSLDGDQGPWYRRNDICNDCTFGSWGKLRGDNHGTDKANMPWSWDDADDGQVFAGDMFCDPAMFFDAHLNGTPFDSGFSHAYVEHPYRTHSVQVFQARSDANRDPFGGASDIYVKVTAAGSPSGTSDVIDARAWKRNSASVGSWYTFRYGADDAEGERRFGDSVTSHSFCRQGAPGVTFSVYDSDTDGDDHMGSITLTQSADYSAGADLGDGRLKFLLLRH